MFDDGGGLGWLDVEVIVDYGSGGVDYDRPGGAAGAVVFHDGRDLVGLRIAGGMGHGDFQAPFQLVFTKFFPGIKLIAFEHCLHGNEFNPVIVFIGPGQLLKGWEPRPAASGSPVLKEIQVNHFAPVVANFNRIHRLPIAIDPGV